MGCITGEAAFGGQRLVESSRAGGEARADVVDLADARWWRQRDAEVACTEAASGRSELFERARHACTEDGREHAGEEQTARRQHAEEDVRTGECAPVLC